MEKSNDLFEEISLNGKNWEGNTGGVLSDHYHHYQQGGIKDAY